MVSDDLIIKKFNECDHYHNKRSYFKNHVLTEEEVKYILSRYNDSSSFNESLDRILNNIEKHPVCKYCGEPVEYIGKKELFRKYCSNKCKDADANLVERHKVGCLRKYGVDNISKVDEIKEKKKQTHIKHYGTENNFGLESVKQTIINKYGIDNISKLDEIKENKKHTTFLHYGVEYYILHPIAREKRKSLESIIKEHETKKKNGSYKNSNEEDYVYILLQKKFGKENIIRQYIDNIKYPFKCDFYIKNYDIYIEYNGYCSHGKHPYDHNSIKDNEILENWKYNNERIQKLTNRKSQYQNYIETWTIRDPKKRLYAKKYNLNYIELWSIDEAQMYINNFVIN